MKYIFVAFTLILSGCSAKPPKTCYELTLTFEGVTSKQIVCSRKPLKESYNFRKI